LLTTSSSVQSPLETSKDYYLLRNKNRWEPHENIFCPLTPSGLHRREFSRERGVVGISYIPGAKRREKKGKLRDSPGSRNTYGLGSGGSCL
jgi:hypothetical protein